MEDVDTTRAETIRTLNDALRRGEAQHGQVLMTQGVTGGGEAFVARVVAGVTAFDDFSATNLALLHLGGTSGDFERTRATVLRAISMKP